LYLPQSSASAWRLPICMSHVLIRAAALAAGRYLPSIKFSNHGFFDMSLDSVRAFFATHAPDIEVIVTQASSATVTLAAEAHGVLPAQIAKTICLRVGDRTMLVVTSGIARLDNRKFKDQFGGKPRMLDAAEVVEATSHPVGGVCPFGLPAPLPVFCDVSLREFEEVVPAAGATNAAVRIGPQRMVELIGADWVDVCQASTDAQERR
jgi:prolyl-tRNA editing enzyme YbaK/EbsC (Cys-tRNA(Pro) deacylase)